MILRSWLTTAPQEMSTQQNNHLEVEVEVDYSSTSFKHKPLSLQAILCTVQVQADQKKAFSYLQNRLALADGLQAQTSTSFLGVQSALLCNVRLHRR